MQNFFLARGHRGLQIQRNHRRLGFGVARAGSRSDWLGKAADHQLPLGGLAAGTKNREDVRGRPEFLQRARNRGLCNIAAQDGLQRGNVQRTLLLNRLPAMQRQWRHFLIADSQRTGFEIAIAAQRIDESQNLWTANKIRLFAKRNAEFQRHDGGIFDDSSE